MTKIEWCDKVWNPTTGCSKGCSYCYARPFSVRLQKNPATAHIYRNGFIPTFHPERLEMPLHWKKPARIFVDSMGDLFDPDITDAEIMQVFGVLRRNQVREHPHTMLILTKQPARMRDICRRLRFDSNSEDGLLEYILAGAPLPLSTLLDHTWFGVSTTNQTDLDARLPILTDTPAVHRFLSIEPMQGPVDLDSAFPGIGWVICGGQTGRAAVPMHPDWVRSLRDQCQAAGVPFFFKGWGEWAPQDIEPDIALDIRGEAAGHVTSYLKMQQPAGMSRVGKKKAGDLLDCREHKEFPTC